MDAKAFRNAGHAAVERIAEYFETLDSRPVSARIDPGTIGKLIPENPPKDGEDFMRVMEDFDRVVLPGITHWQHPSFFAYFPANTNFESIIADMFSGAIFNPAFSWECSPAVTEVEEAMMDWVADLFGLSEEFYNKHNKGAGTVLGTASEACLSIAVAARERALRYLFALALASEPAPKATDIRCYTDFRPAPVSSTIQPIPTFDTMPASQRAELTGRLVMYGSTQTHCMGKKTALILGLTWRSLEVFEEDGWALRGDTLRRALEEDRASGLVPCLLIGTIGTTNSGAIDFLNELTEVARDYPTLWVHVDGAWAGVYLALPELRKSLFAEAINATAPRSSYTQDHKPTLAAKIFESPAYLGSSPADTTPIIPPFLPQSPDACLQMPPGIVHSFCTNLHKAGLVAFECTALFMREPRLLMDALELSPEYLRNKHGDEGTVIEYRNLQLFLGRRFRSLKIFFVLRSYGVNGFRAHLRHLNHLASTFETLVRDSTQFEFVTERSLSLVVFRLNPLKGRPLTGSDKEYVNELNEELNRRLQLRTDIAITGTVIGGCRCIRFAVGCQKSTEESVLGAWKVIGECAEEARTEMEVAQGASWQNSF